MDDPKESEANDFAANGLIPKAEWKAFVEGGAHSVATVRAFSRKLGIAPGIVVGRLQHEKRIPRSYLNELKTKCNPTQ